MNITILVGALVWSIVTIAYYLLKEVSNV